MFAGGLTEELISNLMRFGELRLYSAYGSFLEQPSADPVELASGSMSATWSRAASAASRIGFASSCI